MAVRRGDLQTPSAGPLEDRAVAPATLAAREAQATSDTPAVADLAALRARIEQAARLETPGARRHCFDCWQRGRDAAVAAIRGTRA